MMKFFSKRIFFVFIISLFVLPFVFYGCSNSGSGAGYKVTMERTLSVNENGGVTDEGADGEVVFEVTAERGTGEPVTVTYTFNTYDSPAEIELYNGGNEEPYGELVSSATIVLNGETIFAQNDFNQNVEELEADISLLDGDNVLEVTLKSIPGAKVTIKIEQEIDDEEEAEIEDDNTGGAK